MKSGVAPEMQGQYAQGLRCNGQEVLLKGLKYVEVKILQFELLSFEQIFRFAVV
jgi:hypothetical protein